MIHWQVTFASYLGKTYTVSIGDEGWVGDVVPLTPAAEPFYTEDDADSDILTPMRTQTGYLRVIAESDLTALYPTTPTSRPVIVRDENSDIVWHGYIGCESYSQPWDATPYELELPLVSSIGMLQFLEIESGEMQGRAHIAKYIYNAIVKSGGNFSDIVFPNAFSLDNYGNDVFLRLGIQKRNWFKFTNENMYDKTYPRYEGDTWYNVLEAICETFGFTLYERGTTLYLVERGESIGHYTIPVNNLPLYYGLDSASPTPVSSSSVQISSLTISGTNGTVDTFLPASRAVVESEVNPIDDDAFPIVSTAFLQDTGSIHVTRYYNDDPTGYYYDADLEYYTPTTEGENYWTFASCFNGSETTWDIQDLNRDYSMAVYVRTSSKSDGIFFTRNTLGTGTPDAYFKLKSMYATTFMGGKIKISGTLEADEGDGAGADHCMWMQVKIGDYYYSLGTWLTNPISPRFVVDFNSSSQQIAESIDSNEGLTLQLPTNSDIYGVVEVTCWSPRPKYEQSPGSEGAYLLKNFKLSYEMPEGSIFGDFPVTDTNRFAMDLNTFGEEKTISPILSSYINWRFGYAVLFKPDYSAPVEKVDIGQSQSHEGEDEVYLEKRLLWAMQYYYSTTQREITFPIRTSTIYSPLTFFVDTSSKSHYLLSQATNWRDDEQTIKIFDNLQSSSPSTYRVTVSGNVNEAGISSVAEGGYLSLTLTTADNYTLDSATVTMSGTDITSSAYNNGVVTIASVTGNVVITAATTKLYDAEVEYLQSSGTQWIDTGILPSTSIVADIDFNITAYTQSGDVYQSYLFGSRYYVSSRRACFSFAPKFSQNNTYWYVEVGRSAYNDSKTISLNTAAHVHMTYAQTTVTFGSTTQSKSYSPTWDSSYATLSLYLFNRHNLDTDSSVPFTGRVYGCKIYDGDTLVRDYTPVRKDGVGYMYDRVSRELFGNIGTGTFTYGSDV